MSPATESRTHMAREAVLGRVGSLKKWVLTASVGGFVVLTSLASHHVVGVTSRTGTTPTLGTTNNSQLTQNFFGQQGGGGFNAQPSYSPPVTSTGVS